MRGLVHVLLGELLVENSNHGGFHTDVVRTDDGSWLPNRNDHPADVDDAYGGFVATGKIVAATPVTDGRVMSTRSKLIAG